MPIENIARIEVIRGPGSALYGADAFSGVINIITKTSEDIDGFEAGVRAGSFNSRDVWAQYGGEQGNYDVSGYLRVGSTDGQKSTISVDAMNGSGTANVGRNTIDGRFDLARSNWRFRAGYQRRDKGGTGAGIASALDPNGSNFGERLSTDLTYHDTNLGPDLDATAQVSYLDIVEKSDLTLFPRGTDFSLVFPSVSTSPSLGPFPDGVIGNPYKWERHLRFNAAIVYSGIEDHKVRLGLGTQNDELYRIQESRNYELVPVPGAGYFPAPLGSVMDVTNTTAFLRPHDRRVNYAYAQDEWTFAHDWYLTAGVRRDHYSDFGNTTNPRVALVWETAYNLTSKVLYGRAFRPPSFAELYNINNPVALGNPNLKPETNESYELAFAWQPVTTLQANLNLFRYQMKDILRYVLDTGTGISTAQNAGRQHGQGFEVELVWDVSSDLRLSGNYAQQHSVDEETNQDSGNAPRHHLYARTDWRFMPGWTLDTQLNYVADRKRESGDTRSPVADYHTVDVTMRSKHFENWDVALKVANLFDADAREPAPALGVGNVPLIPYDLPLAPREYRLELSRQF
jgi:iron complex outermembrane receptor protein